MAARNFKTLPAHETILGEVETGDDFLRFDGGTLEGYNPVSRAGKLNRRGEGHDMLFHKQDRWDEDKDDEPVYTGQHELLLKKFLALDTHTVQGTVIDEEKIQALNKARFVAQELKRNKNAGRGQGFSRTMSAPAHVDSAGAVTRPPAVFRRQVTTIDPPDLDKDELRPPQRQEKGKSLQGRPAGVFQGTTGKKSVNDRYHEMTHPWVAMLNEGSKPQRKKTPKVDSDDDTFSDDQGVFSRTKSAPSPKVRGNDVKKISIQSEAAPGGNQHSGFPRTRSAPFESGYIRDEFTRAPSNTSVASISTYQSSDRDFPEAQQLGEFTRSQSVPESPNRKSFVVENGGAAHTGRTPRSARLQKDNLQSAEEFAQELVRNGLTTDWNQKNKMPLCVAQQIASRLNWDGAFLEAMPLNNAPRDGLYTPEYIQRDFASFLARRDVMVLNLQAEFESISASHILRCFSTNQGTALLRKNGGAVEDVVQGVHLQDPHLPAAVIGILDQSYRSCRQVFMSGNVSVLENILYPDDELDEKYDKFSATTAGFSVFRVLDAKLGRSMFYKHIKFQHYCGWLMVQKMALVKRCYKVQYVSAFSASLVKAQVTKLLPFRIRPAKNFSTSLVFHLLSNKYERNFDSVRAHVAKLCHGLVSSADIGPGKHSR